MIEISRVVKRYDKTTAVDELTLHVGAGEWVILAGANGAGKTTTIKILAALIAPTSGAAHVAGFDVTTNPVDVKRAVGYLPEDIVAFGYLTGEEYLHFVAACRQMDRDMEKRRTDELLELFELTERRRTLIRTYSAGMARRLTLAGALLPDPSVLLLDEPTANLDPASADLVRQLLRGLTDRGRTILMSTHLLTAAEKGADRVAILRAGKLILDRKLVDLHVEFPGQDLDDIYLKATGESSTDRSRPFLEGLR